MKPTVDDLIAKGVLIPRIVAGGEKFPNGETAAHAHWIWELNQVLIVSSQPAERRET